jgi:hypothetical protein
LRKETSHTLAQKTLTITLVFGFDMQAVLSSFEVLFKLLIGVTTDKPD